MQAVLSCLRTADPNLEIIEWDEHDMSRPVDQWPIVHVVLPLYSTAFPLPKVLRYVALRSPLLVNNLHMQPLMLDRRLVRRVLARAGVPTPGAIYLDRSAGDSALQAGPYGNTLVVYSPGRSTSYTMEKPFVEKPVDAEDHSTLQIFIIYSTSLFLLLSILVIAATEYTAAAVLSFFSFSFLVVVFSWIIVV